MAFSERLKNFELFEDNKINTADNLPPELVSVCENLSKTLSRKIATIPIWFDYSKKEQQDLILNFLNTKLNEQFSEIKLTQAEKERVCSLFFNSVYGFGTLDFLISQKDITKIFINSPYDVYVERNELFEKSDVIIDEKQFATLIKRLLELSGKKSSVVTFRLNNILVTVLQEPICNTRLILKKISDINFNFTYFENNGNLDKDLSEFFKLILAKKKKILISSPLQCGKTAFLNSFANEISENQRGILFEEGALINLAGSNITRFDTENLTDKEQRDVITAALYYKPDYILSDINDISFNIEVSELATENTGIISTVRANSPNEAISFYTSVLVSKLKCTEKLAKIQFAKDYDYLIQLEKGKEYFTIKSITEISQNRAGTPVLTEMLTINNDKLKNLQFNETKKETPISEIKSENPVNVTFSSRFKQMV